MNIWRETALALRGADDARLAELLPQLPPAAAKAIIDAMQRKPDDVSFPPSKLSGEAEQIGDSRFSAIFAHGNTTVRWDQAGRELVTGCYLTSGGRAEFQLTAGECRFILFQAGDSNA